MYDVSKFTLKDMTICAGKLRSLGLNANSMEDAANRITRHLYEQLIDGRTGANACALVRVFKTHPYCNLDSELQTIVQNVLKSSPKSQDMKCMILLGSAGQLEEWNGRKGSAGHKVIPLESVSFVQRIPMIWRLITQLGLKVEALLSADPAEMEALARASFAVFHVEEAVGSPFVPAQMEFVEQFGVRSVLGFGSVLPSGHLFAVVAFLKCHISKESANMFQTLALAAKLALLPFDNGRLFDESEPKPVQLEA